MSRTHTLHELDIAIRWVGGIRHALGGLRPDTRLDLGRVAIYAGGVEMDEEGCRIYPDMCGRPAALGAGARRRGTSKTRRAPITVGRVRRSLNRLKTHLTEIRDRL